MNCQKFESVASELARGQIMEVDLRDEAFAHSESCSTCASQLRDEEFLSSGLRSLATEMNSFEAPAALEANLLNAFRQQQVVVPMPVRRDHRRYWLAAVAALILIVFSVVAVRVQREGQVSRAPSQSASVDPTKQEPNKDTPKEEQSVQPNPEEQQAINVQPRKPRRQVQMNPSRLQAKSLDGRNKNKDQISNHASNEVATEFMPLGYLNAEAVQDGGQILRVELPRTALVKFGLPVNMDRSNERVKADILVGIDGMAHAIRFVQDRRAQ